MTISFCMFCISLGFNILHPLSRSSDPIDISGSLQRYPSTMRRHYPRSEPTVAPNCCGQRRKSGKQILQAIYHMRVLYLIDCL